MEQRTKIIDWALGCYEDLEYGVARTGRLGFLDAMLFPTSGWSK